MSRTLLIKLITGSLLVIVFAFWITSHRATKAYEKQQSNVIYDRNGVAIQITANNREHYHLPVTNLPDSFTKLLIGKEDQWFYWHPGINPVRTVTALFEYLTTGRSTGASTITQQLAKNLLAQETDRTFNNKLQELWYSFAMELFWRKDTILERYTNTVYLGNQLQGFESASQGYFATSLASTTPAMQLSLLTTLSHPSSRNPWAKDHAQHFTMLTSTLDNSLEAMTPPKPQPGFSLQRDSSFELSTSEIACNSSCTLTLDENLTEGLRNILQRHVDTGRPRGIRSGAIVVIDANTNELLALVGSPDPQNTRDGNQVNMAIQPRPVGSTIKPFIYTAAFEAGLRPYTLVDDREYRYPIATGFSLYPKNYDGKYRGEVTLHEALSNSLNVPTVKTLEYVGLDTFYYLMEDRLDFQPLQDWDQYQYGIALGGLEMDLLTLTHYFGLFPNNGRLLPLEVYNSRQSSNLPPQATITQSQLVFDRPYTELTNTILSDRLTGVNQFGLKNNLSLPITNYAVKTGTSRDYHDSWVVGYTPDLVVGVWLGNTENEPLEQVSGQTGAGAVWHDVMSHLINTDYYTDTPFQYEAITLAPLYDSEEWQLIGDDPSAHRERLLGDNLITSPHPNDTFEFTENTTIPLTATAAVVWTSNGEYITDATESSFSPPAPGSYDITATTENRSETITVLITQPE